MDVGTVVDERYRILRRLGEGAFGEVLEAEDQNLGRLVALKLLKVSVADEELRARFDREARVTAGLTHPHVVTLYDHGVAADGRPYLAYELLEGEDLESRQEAGGIPEADALRWGVEVAEALHFAHERGVIHRDVKPANVFLKQGDVAVLCDFGIARDSTGATALTSEGVLLGTPAYMSPELWRGSTPSAASDQWAWAASLFELVYDRIPYPGTSPREIMEQALDGTPVQVPTGYQGRRPGLEAVLLRGLEADPERRYPDLAAFGEALTEAARGSLQDVLERSGVGVILRDQMSSSVQTQVLPTSPTETQALAAHSSTSGLEPTPTLAARPTGRVPRWILVLGASVCMAAGILWPGGRPPPPTPTPEVRPPTPVASVGAPPEVLARLAPLRRTLLGASRELRRLHGVHPTEEIPDRIVRLTFQPTERMSAVDPEKVGELILQTTRYHPLWKDFLVAAGAWLGELGREQERSEVDLLADPRVIASLEALVYRPILRVLESAHMYFVAVELKVGVEVVAATTNLRALGPPYEDFLIDVVDAWGGRELPPAIANVRDLGHVLGRFHWRGAAAWDGTDRAQLLARLAERIEAARPGLVGAMTLRLGLYHLCLIAKHTDATWAERDAVMTLIKTKLLDDPDWKPPGLDAQSYLGLLGRLVLEEVRQRRVLDAPATLEDHPRSRSDAVLTAFEELWEEDPLTGFYVGAMGWDLARYAGGPGFFNRSNCPAVRPLKRRLEALRNAAHRRAKPGTDRRGDKRKG